MSEVCKKCGKTLALPHTGATFDYTRFCTGYHLPEVPPYHTLDMITGELKANDAATVHISPMDLDTIRTIFREELLRITDEQERKMEELFKQPVEKHDGKLDDGNNWGTSAEVEMMPASSSLGHVQIHGGYGDIESDTVFLDKKQCLSLLAWLLQEQPHLEEPTGKAKGEPC